MPNKSFLARITGIKKKDQDQDQDQEFDNSLDEVEEQSIKNKKLTKRPVQQLSANDSEDWAQENYEGQLSVDVYQTRDEIVIKSAVAGVDPKDLDISISNDMITVRGTRHQEEEISSECYLYQECYWGPFSRSIILPQEVKAEAARAEFKQGILTVRLPKAKTAQKIKIQINQAE
jgi:HSP20 family protein